MGRCSRCGADVRYVYVEPPGGGRGWPHWRVTDMSGDVAHRCVPTSQDITTQNKLLGELYGKGDGE
jgi:hypothetical protein